MKARILAAAVLVLGVCAIYAQTAWFTILACDDVCYTFMCPFVEGGLTWENVKTAFVGEFCWGGIWMPITSVTYMAVISLFGQAAGPQHLVGVAFHALNAVLFFALLLRLGDAGRGTGDARRGALLVAFLAAALWAWHPLRVESVAWIASRKDTIFTAFTLLGLLAWERGKWGWGTAWMALSCMSKPTAMCFPLLALAVEYLSPKTGAECPTPRASLKYVPLFVLAAATGLLATYSQSHGVGGDLELYYGTLSWRLTNAAVSLGMHLYHMVLPLGLNYFYRPVYGGTPLDAALGLSVLALFSAAVGLAYWRFKAWRRAIFWCGFWFMASIGPTLGIAASFGHQAYADRFTYVPMMAFSALLVAGLAGRGQRPAVLAPALAVAALGYAAVAGWYAGTFRDDLAVFSRVLACDEGNADAWRGVGGAKYLRNHDPSEAIPYFRKAIEVDPQNKAGKDLLYMLRERNRPEDREEFARLTEQFRRDPSLDEDGLVLDMLMQEAMRANDLDGARRYLEAMTKVQNERFASRARAILSRLGPPRYGPLAK